MNKILKWVGLFILCILFLILLVYFAILIGIWIIKAFQTLWILIIYLTIVFLPKILVSLLVLILAVALLLLIPSLWVKLSTEVFSILKRRNYSRIVSIVTPSFSIITGLILGLIMTNINLWFMTRLMFGKNLCGDNNNYINQGLYQVFVEKGKGEMLQHVRQNYCKYAVKKYRKDQNKQSILVASFQSESKANQFVNMMKLDHKIRNGELVKPGLTCKRFEKKNLYSVFVNKTDVATLKYIRKNYCQDALIQYRKDIKIAENEDRQSILVTNFLEKTKALEFARILQTDSEVNSGDLRIPGLTCHQSNSPDLYPVFVNKTDATTLKYIRDNYCQDAKIINRKEDSQKYKNIPAKSILVALFKSKQQALDFARYLQKDSQIRSGELGALGLY